jgi:hypothetical protein
LGPEGTVHPRERSHADVALHTGMV